MNRLYPIAAAVLLCTGTLHGRALAQTSLLTGSSLRGGPSEIHYATTGRISVRTTPAVPKATRSFGMIFGTVTDENGAPVANAQIEVVSSVSSSSSRVARTSSTGDFAIDSLSPGLPYTVIATQLGYRAVLLEPIVLQADSTRTVRMSLATRPITIFPVKGAPVSGASAMPAAPPTDQPDVATR